MPGAPPVFPPKPRGLRGRAAELHTLEEAVRNAAPARLALVGGGGSGKSMLAAALGHRLAAHFPGGLHWFRVGAWDFHTLTEMLALRFGTSRARSRLTRGVRAFLNKGGARLLVLDNHEDDQAMARLLGVLDGLPVTVIITARRCLLGGVLVFPVTAPRVTSGESAFPRVASLTRLLRWSPLALDIADAVVASGAATEARLGAALQRAGVNRVRVIDHEDDLPEVACLLGWAWTRLPAESRRMLAVLAHTEGDHLDERSLATLAEVGAGGPTALAALERWHLVQEPLARRFTLHAVVRHAVLKRTEFDRARFFEHYVGLLEHDPGRLLLEQTHLFAAMDYAHRQGDLGARLRVERLLTLLDPEAMDF